MNSKFTLFILLALAVAILAGLPSFAAGIQGSKHDFTGASWSGNEICAPCHTPHNASSEAALWARALPESSSFTLWGGDDVLGVKSLTCLSCHDGVLALGFGGQTMGELYTNSDLGTDLTNDHPIGVAYDVTGGGRGLKAATSVSSRSAKMGSLSLYPDAGGEYRIECSSCHSVHGSDVPGALLRESNYGSALCLECHIK